VHDRKKKLETSKFDGVENAIYLDLRPWSYRPIRLLFGFC